MTQANAAQLKAELDAGEEILRTATLARLAYDGVDDTPRVILIGLVALPQLKVTCRTGRRVVRGFISGCAAGTRTRRPPA